MLEDEFSGKGAQQFQIRFAPHRLELPRHGGQALCAEIRAARLQRVSGIAYGFGITGSDAGADLFDQCLRAVEVEIDDRGKDVRAALLLHAANPQQRLRTRAALRPVCV